ncbi:hypothetical protein HXX02_00795 [Microbulbifer elongatus]|uniref:Spermidine synthase n=1 Tax=Microbulbifer elongatus TaxID=86173 RepID=A0ABT1NXG4_9GAMM|nr:hypothetical protein [Microbulbifer elongatus]MCQ3827972.1 hypothetical protein [Microbulbifer elongatus]
MKLRFLCISFIVGLISLGEEIVWVRIVSFLGQSVPQTFAFVLFCYVLGIALGALFGARLAKKCIDELRTVSLLLGVSGCVVVVSPWAVAEIYSKQKFLILVGLLIATGAALKGAIFPLVHHWFSRPGVNLGRTLSWVYFSNVMGCALGPLIVGFYLLDYLPMFQALSVLGGVEIMLAAVFSFLRSRMLSVTAFACLLATVPLIQSSQGILKQVISFQFSPSVSVTNIIENRHGVIYTIDDGSDVDFVYGGNVYDGGFNVDLISNENGISRAFLLAGLHAEPKSVLFVGLSSGSWLRVVSAMPGVEAIDVVEINPGYMELIQKYPGAEDILSDSRIKFHFTDGRRLLKKSVDERKKYDLIVMNNTWHWRANSTNLLSSEFMGLLKSAIAENGVITFNTTRSVDVFYTASRVFDGAFIYRNFVYASDHDLNTTLASNGDRLCMLSPARLEGQSCENSEFLRVVEKLKTIDLLSWGEAPEDVLMDRKPEIITDDNMIVEYKYGRSMNIF